jgi:hypothetical protein
MFPKCSRGPCSVYRLPTARCHSCHLAMPETPPATMRSSDSLGTNGPMLHEEPSSSLEMVRCAVGRPCSHNIATPREWRDIRHLNRSSFTACQSRRRRSNSQWKVGSSLETPELSVRRERQKHVCGIPIETCQLRPSQTVHREAAVRTTSEEEPLLVFQEPCALRREEDRRQRRLSAREWLETAVADGSERIAK